MSQKKPTLGRGLADLLGQTLRPAAPLAPVPVQIPGASANGAGSGSGPNAGGNPAGTAVPAGAPSAAAAPAGAASQTGSGQPGALEAANSDASLVHDEELARLPLDLLQRGKYQPRVDMRPETLQELADSIKAQGVVQPIVVRPVGVPGTGESQRYEIIAGERRWRAAQMAG